MSEMKVSLTLQSIQGLLLYSDKDGLMTQLEREQEDPVENGITEYVWPVEVWPDNYAALLTAISALDNFSEAMDHLPPVVQDQIAPAVGKFIKRTNSVNWLKKAGLYRE